MSLVEVRLLGPLEAGVGGRPVELRRRKQRELLALLALRVGEVVPTDRLIDDLWGETPPKAAVGSLQNLVSELRKILPPEVLATRPPGYVLEVERDAVDAHRFERLAREARVAAPKERVALLRDALGLWRGPALADVQLQQAFAGEAARLEELRLAGWEDRLEAELELGQHGQTVGELESLVAKHPLRERPAGLLMLALYRSGRQAEALETYRRARARLVEELGIDPSPELQRLEQAILRHDPELDLHEAPRRHVPPSGPDRRKTVTMLFADLVDSTELGARLDPEVLRRVLDRYFELVRGAVERHGGVVEKFIGDAAMAVFGIPTVHEDDALRAVRAASELREALAEPSEDLTGPHGIPLQVRVGINTGEVLVRSAESGEAFATGNAVNIAARLEQAALPGEILVSEATHRLVQHAVESEPVDPVDLGGALGRASVYRVGGVGEAVWPLGGAALVGREDELAWLQAAFAGVQAERRSRVVTVLGEAGVGKSRLAREFAATAGEQPLVGRCVSYGEGATFFPLAQIVRQAVPERPRAAILALLEGDDQAPIVAERVTHLTEPAAGAASTGEVFWAVRRFLEALARERPVVVVLEDIHWAEPTLLDLIEYLDSWPAEGPLLVLCLARRELLEERPGWGSRNGVLALEPLSDAQAGALLEAGAASVDEEARGQIIQIAAGNPLFLEQLLAFVQEAGPDALGSVPPTVEALLAGRLERLDPAERALTERAAVVGRDFSRGGLLALSPPDEIAGLDSRLTALVRRGLVRALRGGDGDRYRFHHILVRDVAYAGTTKEARAELHERFGTWLEQRGRAADEIVGYHLEQAHRYRKELDPGDSRVAGLAQRGGRVLADAGIGAWKRADATAAGNLLGRAASLLPAGEPRRAEILCELGMALRQLGNASAGEDAFTEAIDEAAAARDEASAAWARIELARARLHRGGDPEELVALVQEATPLLEEAGNDRALGRAWRAAGYARGAMQGRCADWLEASERALPYYRRSGFSTSGCLSEITSALYNGPTPVPVAEERCERLLAEATDRPGKAHVLAHLAGLHAYDERGDEALRLLDEAETVYRDLRDDYNLANTSGRIRGRVHALAEDHEAAQTVFRSCCETFGRFGDAAALTSVAAELGGSLYAQSRIDEAREWSALAEREAPAGDVVAQFSWRSLKAKLLAHDRRPAEAEPLAMEALSLVEQTDALTDQGDVLLAVATVLTAANRPAEAAERVRQAIELYERKQNAASARNARARLAGAQVV
ncbi:MAG TPA: BTAD domain-containing putative transcriptional regulator [Gaiellaceae bacterium]|nr:BTAD domain-containing putative transcriptional regulator [Gaiellaceae bacterium]